MHGAASGVFSFCWWLSVLSVQVNLLLFISLLMDVLVDAALDTVNSAALQRGLKVSF